MHRADLRVSVEHCDTETVVAVAGELDMSTAERLSATIAGELRHGPRRIVVDLANLTFCDSLGLGTLVVLSRTARIQQTYLLLRNPSPFFTRMLAVTGVRQGLNISEKVPENVTERIDENTAEE
jgi:anti-sigma B factor antagonist